MSLSNQQLEYDALNALMAATNWSTSSNITWIELAGRDLNSTCHGKDPRLTRIIQCHPEVTTVVAIDLSNMGLMGTIPDDVGSLTSLTRLAAGNNSLRGIIPATVMKLTQLQHLEVYQNRLSNHLPYDWSPLTNLKRVLVSQNQFSGTLSDSICLLTSLHGLDLFDNPLEGTIPDCLGTLASLTALQIRNTKFTGTIPKHLCVGPAFNGLSSANQSFGCEVIACPVGTYQTPDGRQTTSQSPCLTCSTANYLASTTCPTITLSTKPSPSPSPSSTGQSMPPSSTEMAKKSSMIPERMPTGGPSSVYSLLRQPTLIPTLMPTPLDTSWKPSSQASSIVPPPNVPTILPVEKGGHQRPIPVESISSEMITKSNHPVPTLVPTLVPPVSSQHPSLVMVSTLVPSLSSYLLNASNSVGVAGWSGPSPTNTSNVPNEHTTSSNGGTNWLLLSFAFLLSTVAMVSVVLGRRIRHSWWRQHALKARTTTATATTLTMPPGIETLPNERVFNPSSLPRMATTTMTMTDDHISLESDSGWNDTMSSNDSVSLDENENDMLDDKEAMYTWSVYSQPLTRATTTCNRANRPTTAASVWSIFNNWGVGGEAFVGRRENEKVRTRRKQRNVRNERLKKVVPWLRSPEILCGQGCRYGRSHNALLLGFHSFYLTLSKSVKGCSGLLNLRSRQP